MRVLFVSTMRFGDLFTHFQIIQSFQQKNPDAEVHVLTNEENLPATEVLPKSIHWHYFRHKAWGTGFADKTVPEAKPMIELDSLIQELSELNFDDCYNLTFTRLGAMLAGSISCRQGLIMYRAFYPSCAK